MARLNFLALTFLALVSALPSTFAAPTPQPGGDGLDLSFRGLDEPTLAQRNVDPSVNVDTAFLVKKDAKASEAVSKPPLEDVAWLKRREAAPSSVAGVAPADTKWLKRSPVGSASPAKISEVAWLK